MCSSLFCGGAHQTIADALLQKHSCLWFLAMIRLAFFHMVRAGAYWHKIHDIHACAFAVQTKQSVTSFGFLFRRRLRRHCKIFNMNAEKPKFYSSKAVYFALADFLDTKKVQEAKFKDCHWCISIHFASLYFDEKEADVLKLLVVFFRAKIRFRSFTQFQIAQKNNST